MMNSNRTASFLYLNSNSSISAYDNHSGLHLSTSEGQTAVNSEHLKLVEYLTTMITLIVSVIGLIGNGCTIVVLNRQSMRKWRSSVLLSALAAVDFLYLSIIFLSIIDSLSKEAMGFNRSIILCQTTVYITHVCSFLSAAFTLSFTLQRFVAVLFPLHAGTIISNRSSTINISLLVVFGCGFYSFSFFLTNISNGQCKEDEKYPALFPLLIVDTCLTFVVPFIFIVLFNCAIVYKLQNRKKFANIFGGSLTTTTTRNRHQRTSSPTRAQENEIYHEQERLCQSNSSPNDYIPLKNGNKTPNGLPLSLHRVSSSHAEAAATTTAGNGYTTRPLLTRMSTVTVNNEFTPVPSSTPNHTSTNNHRQAISQRTTKMLVICSTTFLLFNSPYCAVLLYSIISGRVLTHALGILRHFYFMSFCLNFFLYSLCGNRFRRELILLFQACGRKCCTQSIRSHWSRAEKIPQRASFARVASRADV